MNHEERTVWIRNRIEKSSIKARVWESVDNGVPMIHVATSSYEDALSLEEAKRIIQIARNNLLTGAQGTPICSAHELNLPGSIRWDFEWHEANEFILTKEAQHETTITD